jgi:hypothetical protein
LGRGGVKFDRITGDPTSSTVDEDYAVLVMNERLGDAFGWLGTKVYNSSWDGESYWINIGYPTDVAGGNFPTFQKPVSLDEDAWDYGSGRSMTTSADENHGASGGPMFGFWPNDPGAYAVAVVSAGSSSDNWCSGGSDLTRLVNQARSENP